MELLLIGLGIWAFNALTKNKETNLVDSSASGSSDPSGDISRGTGGSGTAQAGNDKIPLIDDDTVLV